MWSAITNKGNTVRRPLQTSSPVRRGRFAVFAQFFAKGNTAQRASGDFARHLLANFPSEPVSYLLARILRAYFPRYFGKILENPQRIFSVFPFISQKIWRRNLHTSDTKQTLIFHKNAREYIKYSLRFLFHLTKNLTTHLSHNLCAVLPSLPKNTWWMRTKLWMYEQK